MSIPHPGFRIPHSRQQRRAFTLIELLTVIIIIGILMAILVPAVMNARVKGMESQMVAEITQLDTAMKQFRTNYTVLPPALHTPGNAAQVRAFWRRVWTRWDNSSTPVADLNCAEVLVFYLGGMPGTVGTKTTGFNLNPLSPASTGGQRSPPLFQFDQGRLLDENGNGYYEYYPPHKRTVGDGVPPYVYFDFTSYPQPGPDGQWGAGGVNDNNSGANPNVPFTPDNITDNILEAVWPLTNDIDFSFTMTGVSGVARPYASTATGGWMNADSFQIIGAGLDNDYGNILTRMFPSGGNYAPSDYDNVTNFSTSRLEDAIP